jgi:integrase
MPGYALVATAAEARRLFGDLDELRALRLKRAGGRVFKRGRSPYWQIRYLAGDGKWRDESSHTRQKRDAEALLAEKVYQASAGLLPGTATFEGVIAHFLRDARVRGLRSVARLECACKALLNQLAGHRAEKIDRALWLKYLEERQQEAAPDTVHLELSIARRAYRVALAAGLVRAVPDIPRVPHLNVRAGFIDRSDWPRVRQYLRPDLGDACEFALACGARAMEVLALKWADVEAPARVVHLSATKTDQPRKLPYAASPRLAAVIERRALVRASLERAGVISPWVFCFAEPVIVRKRLYHRSGEPLFTTAVGTRGLRAILRDDLTAACARAGVRRLLFHDFRRSAARDFERAGVPRSVAQIIGGWSPQMYSRYAIGDESELGAALAQADEWHSGGTPPKSSMKSPGFRAREGTNRTG